MTATGRTPVLSQLSQLSTQMGLAQAERAEAEARLAQLRGLMSGGISAVADVLDVAAARKLARRRGDCWPDGGPNWPGSMASAILRC